MNELIRHELALQNMLQSWSGKHAFRVNCQFSSEKKPIALNSFIFLSKSNILFTSRDKIA